MTPLRRKLVHNLVNLKELHSIVVLKLYLQIYRSIECFVLSVATGRRQALRAKLADLKAVLQNRAATLVVSPMTLTLRSNSER